MLSKRSFLTGLIAAPVIIRASSLMPVKPVALIIPEPPILTGVMLNQFYRNQLEMIRLTGLHIVDLIPKLYDVRR